MEGFITSWVGGSRGGILTVFALALLDERLVLDVVVAGLAIEPGSKNGDSIRRLAQLTASFEFTASLRRHSAL